MATTTTPPPPTKITGLTGHQVNELDRITFGNGIKTHTTFACHESIDELIERLREVRRLGVPRGRSLAISRVLVKLATMRTAAAS